MGGRGKEQRRRGSKDRQRTSSDGTLASSATAVPGKEPKDLKPGSKDNRRSKEGKNHRRSKDSEDMHRKNSQNRRSRSSDDKKKNRRSSGEKRSVRRNSLQNVAATFKRNSQERDEREAERGLADPREDAALAGERTRKAEAWAKQWNEMKIYDEWQSLKNFTNLPPGSSTNAYDGALAKQKRKGEPVLDHHRVRLFNSPTIATNEFINANFTDRGSGGKPLILAAGPTKDTLPDWWTMIIQQKVNVIVSLCKPGEEDVVDFVPKSKEELLKVHALAPLKAKLKDPYAEVGLEDVELLPSEKSPIMRVSSLLLTFPTRIERVKHSLVHIQYLGWPDKDSVPADLLSIVALHEQMEKRDKAGKVEAPILIHCTGGLGRSGAFAAFDHAYRLLTVAYPHVPSVHFIVKAIRWDRHQAVQTYAQYNFVYAATVTALSSSNVFKHRHRVPKLIQK